MQTQDWSTGKICTTLTTSRAPVLAAGQFKEKYDNCASSGGSELSAGQRAMAWSIGGMGANPRTTTATSVTQQAVADARSGNFRDHWWARKRPLRTKSTTRGSHRDGNSWAEGNPAASRSGRLRRNASLAAAAAAAIEQICALRFAIKSRNWGEGEMRHWANAGRRGEAGGRTDRQTDAQMP